jgi:hypothetical protein
MFERVIYVSRAAAGVSARDTYEIIRVSHNRNRQFRLTGVLILLDGWFLQVLEGEGRSVRQRFAVIAADTRHCGVEVRRHIRTQRLAFPEEWMAYRSGEEIAATTKQDFGYLPGFPACHFGVEKLLAFAQVCCRPQAESGPTCSLRAGTLASQ